jgi:hypothetical protein
LTAYSSCTDLLPPSVASPPLHLVRERSKLTLITESKLRAS